MEFKSLNRKFMEEISRIKDPQIFLGIARILKIKLLDENNKEKDFTILFEEVMDKFNSSDKKRKRELFKILKEANKEEVILNGN